MYEQTPYFRKIIVHKERIPNEGPDLIVRINNNGGVRQQFITRPSKQQLKKWSTPVSSRLAPIDGPQFTYPTNRVGQPEGVQRNNSRDTLRDRRRRESEYRE